jgi:transposase-like protein
VDRISLTLTVQGAAAAAAAPRRDLNPPTPRAATQQLDSGAQDAFRASVTVPQPNRYDEAIDRLRLAALRRDAAAAATAHTAKANTPTDDAAVEREGPERSGP